jgi:hypothetical protein
MAEKIGSVSIVVSSSVQGVIEQTDQRDDDDEAADRDGEERDEVPYGLACSRPSCMASAVARCSASAANWQADVKVTE